NWIFARVCIFVSRQFCSGRVGDGQFFFQFACERLFRCFSKFHLAPGEFPFQRMGLPRLAAADQNISIPLNQSGHDLDHVLIGAYILTDSTMRFAISIRGGGVRGIIPCYCLMKLEAQLGGVTRDHIDYCAGTSTGALLTAATAAGIPASVSLKVYTDRSPEIFTPTGGVAEAKRFAVGFMFDP